MINYEKVTSHFLQHNSALVNIPIIFSTLKKRIQKGKERNKREKNNDKQQTKTNNKKTKKRKK